MELALNQREIPNTCRHARSSGNGTRIMMMGKFSQGAISVELLWADFISSVHNS